MYIFVFRVDTELQYNTDSNTDDKFIVTHWFDSGFEFLRNPSYSSK